MFKAINSEGELLHAKDALKGETYYCPACGKKVVLKRAEVQVRIAHFAHESKCSYPFEKEYMSDWHIRMQSYFPKESREICFTDSETGERHRADVYLEDKRTVIEIQKSFITPEEFKSRTRFHLKNGRRMVWIFDESNKSPKKGDQGKLRPDPGITHYEPHKEHKYKWLNKRKCLLAEGIPGIKYWVNDPTFAVCLFTGADDEDTVHRIIDEEDEFTYLTLSINNLRMSIDLDMDDFFRDEAEWIPKESKWKDIFDRYRQGIRALKEYDANQEKQMQLLNDQRKAEKDKSNRKALMDMIYGRSKRNGWF